MILAAAAAIAAPAAIHFAPPAAPFDVVTEEVHGVTGRLVHFSMRHRVRFSRLGAGWRMDATLIDYATDARGPTRTAFEGGMKPFAGVATAVAVSAAGTPVSALDADAAWARIAEGQRVAAAAITASGLPAATATALRAHFEEVAGLKGEARDAMLTAFAWDLLALSAPALTPGQARPYEGGTTLPGAGAIEERGTTRYVAHDGDEARFTLDAQVDPADLARAADGYAGAVTGGDPAIAARLAAAVARLRATRVSRHDDYRLDTATGLIRASASTRETLVDGRPTQRIERRITVSEITR